MQARVGLLVLIGTAPFAELAQNFIMTLPKIEQFINENSRPFIAKVYRPTEKVRTLNPNHPGRVELWVNRKLNGFRTPD